MRKIKFRCWDKKNKVWVDADTISITLSGVPIALNETWMKHNLADLILMQFTGLKDKNGREIYEGDIVRVIDMPCSPDEHEWKGEVVFKHSCWEVVGREELLLYVFEYTNDNGYKPLLYEVIGNIYENPGLLTSEKGE